MTIKDLVKELQILSDTFGDDLPVKMSQYVHSDKFKYQEVDTLDHIPNTNDGDGKAWILLS